MWTWMLLACAGAVDTSINRGAPLVTIASPEDGATVCGSPLVVQVEVANLTLAAPVSDPADAAPGTGHVDIMLNGQDADMIWDDTAEIEDVADGAWQLKVELSGADHAPIEPYTYDLIYITVDALACG